MIKGYFHIATMYGGSLIAAEMHGRFMQSGLYDVSDEIKVVILGPKVTADYLCDFIFNKYSKYKVIHINENFLEHEWPTLMELKKDADESSDDYNIWYAHTKGASNCRPDVDNRIQNNIRDWRENMAYFIIGDHKKCTEILNQGADVVGTLKWVDPVSKIPFFMGNWWWASSRHIKSLPPLAIDDRKTEGWLGGQMIETPEKFINLCNAPCIDLYDFSNVWGEFGPLHKSRWVINDTDK
jgi:hypothetical protein